MKKIVTLATAITACTLVFAFGRFSKVCENPSTPVKNQANTGTCWCFATVSFMESELLRCGKGEYDLSEMFVVRNNYDKRLKDNYLRQGKGNLTQGSIAHMVVNVIKEHGIMPEEAYHGINYNSELHDHSEMAEYIKAIAGVAVDRKNCSPEYEKLMKNLFDTYLGEVPETFEYRGKTYTAKSFASELGLDNMDDYIELTSVSHHPFYQQVPLEIPDNWDHQLLYNVPIEDFIAIIDNALQTGYTLVWDGDLTKGEYYHSRGVADCEIPEITQEVRQYALEHFATVDDHLMHIVGIYKDFKGDLFYKTKDSGGPDAEGNINGFHYLSRSYVKMRTVSILVHKDGIPEDVRQKLGLQ